MNHKKIAAWLAAGLMMTIPGISIKGEGIPMLDPSRLHVGEKVSGAYVDPEAGPRAYEYDRDSLVYELVWADEFDADGPVDEGKWSFETGGHGWGNNEPQYYTQGENAWVEGGHLVIQARKEARGGNPYTSARMVSRGKGDWRCGKFEIRAQLPKGLGTWPALWMMPTQSAYDGWPKSGEIDIMEHVGYDQDRVHASVHTGAYNHVMGTHKTATILVPGASEGFHTYTLEWLPDQIIMGVDGKEYYTYNPARYKADFGFMEWPFDQRFYLIFNIAFGGNWGGARGVDEGVLPQNMLVDYVRVYQSPQIQALLEETK